MPKPFSPSLDAIVPLPRQDSWPEAGHRFDEDSVRAVQTALAIQRPLLLRGEPGIGKSQLARAVAAVLEVPFLYHVVDERTERDDLLFHYDAVARLAEAQVASLTAKEDPHWKKRLAERNFIRPGVLWWAFDWDSAAERAKHFHTQLERHWTPPSVPEGWSPSAERLCGPVVLIDEIDKADPSVPNGLLECLGNEGFKSSQFGEAVNKKADCAPPFIVITTNEERDLPAAFLRRCLVLHMPFPTARAEAVDFLERRAAALEEKHAIDPKIRRLVAECIVDDRAKAGGRLALPGASEFLELLRALVLHAPGDVAEQEARLREIQKFVLRKHDGPA